jgi:hypothetical protein
MVTVRASTAPRHHRSADLWVEYGPPLRRLKTVTLDWYRNAGLGLPRPRAVHSRVASTFWVSLAVPVHEGPRYTGTASGTLRREPEHESLHHNVPAMTMGPFPPCEGGGSLGSEVRSPASSRPPSIPPSQGGKESECIRRSFIPRSTA